MKILFSNPPGWIDCKDGIWSSWVRSGSRWPFSNRISSSPDCFISGDYLPAPLFLQFAASWCRRATGATVHFRDSIALRESYETFRAILHKEKYDVMVIESGSPCWDHDAQLIRQIHRLLPQCRIIVTGPIATTKGEEILATQPVFAVVKGEYENGVVRAINGENGVIDFDLLSEAEMNVAPLPVMSQLYAERYWDQNPRGQVWPQGQVWTSRGCVYKCLMAETMVNTALGDMSIEGLAKHARDIDVIGFDPKTGKTLATRAINIRQYGTANDFVSIEFGDKPTLHCTPDHKLLRHDWRDGAEKYVPVEAKDIRPGMCLVSLNHSFEDKTVKRVDSYSVGPRPVYCLEVPETHWFFANNVAVSNCIFCSWPATMTGNDPDGNGRRSVRRYSHDYLLGWLTEWRDRFGFRCFYLDDDWMNSGDTHTLACCEVMRKVGLPWSAMCRGDSIKRETWQTMKDSGCFGVKIGIESGVSSVVNGIIRKNLDLEKLRDTLAFLKKIGISRHGTFSYGAPGETLEQMAETRRYRDSLGLDSYQESGMAVIEGTPLATLEQVGTLKKYPGAAVDGQYVRDADGNRKMATMEERMGKP